MLQIAHKSHKPRAQKESLEGVQKESSHAGGRFSVVGELWVSRGTLDLLFPENFNPMSQLRYQSPDTEACGTIAEIYLDLKPHLQSILADAGQRPLFKQHVSFDLCSVCAHD